MKFGHFTDKGLPESDIGYRCPSWEPMPDGKKNVVILGCSHTYGVGLKDCWLDVGGPGDLPPSKLAWPQLMANKLNIECINASKWGSSNRETWHRIINFDFKFSLTE